MAASKKSDQSSQPKATYPVLLPLDHDNESYAKGDGVDLTEKQAEPLLSMGVVGPAPAAEAAAA